MAADGEGDAMNGVKVHRPRRSPQACQARHASCVCGLDHFDYEMGNGERSYGVPFWKYEGSAVHPDAECCNCRRPLGKT